MTTLVLGNQLSRLQRFLEGTSGPLRYICLVETKESRLIRDYLCLRPGAEEIPKAKLFREQSEEFRGKYIEFMGRLNSANYSHQWWAMSFTNKYPLGTPLCRNAFELLLTVNLLHSGSQPLLVITDSTDLAEQATQWAKTKKVDVVNAVKSPFEFKRFLKQHTPAGLVKAILQTWLLSAFSRRLRPRKNMRNEHLLITTHTHLRSFSDPPAYHDVYFGPLVDQAAASGYKAIILGSFHERPIAQLGKLKTLKSGIPLVPLEACLTLKSLVWLIWKALKLYLLPIKPNGPIEIDGLDVSFLLNQSIKQSLRSGDLFLNLRAYQAASFIAGTLQVTRCIYPYENRSWEKMLLLGLSSVSPETRTIGYQHAAITPHHTNFMLDSGEAEVTPLPNAILTCGEVTRDWLSKEGNYPQGLFKTACALRQNLTSPLQGTSQNKHVSKLLLVLGTDQEEVVKTPVFLEEALASTNGYQVRIRPHPNAPGLNLPPSPLFSVSEEPLADDLDWAHAVLYSSSTVAMEAIFLGTPAIFVDIGGFLNTDPMFGWDEFKWSVTEPSELLPTLAVIQRLPENEFHMRQQKGREYVTDYLRPVTGESLATFWEA